jgi:hypothetical protein
MYYYLKNNVFYLKQKNNGLFIKNSFCSVSINNSNSYKIFESILPALNGQINVESQIQTISNEAVKNFIVSLMDIFKNNKLVLYSDSPINIEDYTEEEQSILFCYGGEIPKRFKSISESYIVSASDEKTGRKICELLEGEKTSVDFCLTNERYIGISGSQRLYIYKSGQELIVSAALPDDDAVEDGLSELPLHIFEIIASFLKIELMLNAINIKNIDFEKNNYVFDLKLLSSKTVPIGASR